MTVDFDAKTTTVTMKPGATLVRGAVERAFEGSRYGVTSLEDR